MGFNFDKYKAADFQSRFAEVDVPELRDYFPEGEKPLWKVRNLTAVEMAKCREAVERNSGALRDLISSLVYADGENKGGAISDIKAESDSMVPGDIVRRYEILMAGSVDPEVKEKPDAIMIGKNHPGEFYEITNKILDLTGRGALPGKQKPCGETKESGQA